MNRRKVVTQQMVRDGTTPEIRQQLSEIASIVTPINDRNERLVKFQEIRESSTLSDSTKALLELITEKEQQHIDHVRQSLLKIPQYPAELIKERPHDFSKDHLYFFCTAGKFDCQVDTEAMHKLFELEVRRHYELEPHHQQHEEIHGVECTEVDILEMAVDRLSRSAQAGAGKIDLANMMLPHHLPVFKLGDHGQKKAKFLEFVHKYKDLVEGEYNSLFAVQQSND